MESQSPIVPLEMDDGLYALVLESVSSDDTRYFSSRIFDLTPPGEYSPVTQKAERSDDSVKTICGMWTTMRLPATPPVGRIAALAGFVDFHSELISFSDKFLAPAGLPPGRKQFDVTNVADMSDLSIRFMGGGTDRILHTVGISNGLSKPPSKKHVRVPPLSFPQGNMKAFKTPRVSKDLVGHLHQASVRILVLYLTILDLYTTVPVVHTKL